MWNNFERDKNILYNQHKAPVFSNEGLDFYTLKRDVLKIYENDPVSFENKGRMIKYILSNARVSVVPEDFFQDKLDLNNEVIMGADIRNMGNKAFQKSVSHLLDGTALAQELLSSVPEELKIPRISPKMFLLVQRSYIRLARLKKACRKQGHRFLQGCGACL